MWQTGCTYETGSHTVYSPVKCDLFSMQAPEHPSLLLDCPAVSGQENSAALCQEVYEQ